MTHVWRPYTQHATAAPPLEVARGEGAWLVLADGRRVLDGIGSWWTCLHGHGHPRLVRALAEQAATLDHVIFAGCTHAPAEELAGRLARLAGLDRVFYSDNGSTAVEVALKMAFQYQRQAGRGERTRFVRLPHAYHGDTVGAMSVSGVALFRDAYGPLLFSVTEDDGGPLGEDVAAVLVEPMVQGAGGMRVHSADRLRDVARRCREAGALLIADEVMTGFGRTGEMFSCEHAGVRPDLMCLSKAITGGLLPFAATLARETIFDAFLSADDPTRTLFHGHSFAGNPLGCALALESLAIFDDEPVLERARAIGTIVARELAPLQGRVADVRGLGVIRAVELPADQPGYLAGVGARLHRAALERGVLLRPLGNVLYCLPPLCLTDDEAVLLGRTMRECTEAAL